MFILEVKTNSEDGLGYEDHLYVIKTNIYKIAREYARSKLCDLTNKGLMVFDKVLHEVNVINTEDLII